MQETGGGRRRRRPWWRLQARISGAGRPTTRPSLVTTICHFYTDCHYSTVPGVSERGVGAFLPRHSRRQKIKKPEREKRACASAWNWFDLI